MWNQDQLRIRPPTFHRRLAAEGVQLQLAGEVVRATFAMTGHVVCGVVNEHGITAAGADRPDDQPADARHDGIRQQGQ